MAVAALGFLLYRGTVRRLWFFGADLLALLVFNSTWLVISNNPVMFRSTWAYHYFWWFEMGLSCLRLVTIGEISWRTLRRYPAVWQLASTVLLLTASVLLFWTAMATRFNPRFVQQFVDVGLQRLEFLQAVLLLVVLSMIYRYRIPVIPLHRLVILGLCVYSSIQVFNNELGWLEPIRLFPVFDNIRRVSITISESIWLYAASRPVVQSTTESGAVLAYPNFEELIPAVHRRLQELNDRLADLLRV